jgi:putative ABC transport system permease protein
MRRLPFEYSVRNLGRSPARLAAIVLGSTLVVGLVLAAGAFMRGMNQSLVLGGAEKNVLLLGAGSEESIERSEVPASTGALAAASVRGLKEVNGVPYVSPEVNVALIARTAPDDPIERRGVVRGVTPTAFLVHPQVQIKSGRAPRQGTNEMIVGALAAQKLDLPESALAEGEQLYIAGKSWTIVGRFSAPGTVMDAELWTPLNDMLIALKRVTISAVTVTLDTAEFGDIDAFTKQRFDLELAAVRESDYYAGLMRFYRPVRWMIGLTALLVSLTGLFGGLNTLYAAFASRIREIGMLQSVGFTRGAIVWSLFQESMLSAAAGTLIAATLALTMLDGVAVEFSLGVFALQVDGMVLLSGIAAGAVLGLIGAIPPAIRCLRVPIAESLKAT